MYIMGKKARGRMFSNGVKMVEIIRNGLLRMQVMDIIIYGQKPVDYIWMCIMEKAQIRQMFWCLQKMELTIKSFH